jgi:hypothetical protein
MDSLVMADSASEWPGLKALVLDSVSSPITRQVKFLVDMPLSPEMASWLRSLGSRRRPRERVVDEPRDSRTPNSSLRPVLLRSG